MYEKDSILLEQDSENGMPETYKIYRKYTQNCIKAGAMDFDDLLLQLFRLFRKIQTRFLKNTGNNFGMF